jgi:DNA repair protein RadC
MQSTFLDLTDPPVATSRRARAAKAVPTIREALAPYLDTDALLQVVNTHTTTGYDLSLALRTGEAPAEIRAILQVLQELLTPGARTQITSPADLAGLLMVQMAAYDQEHLITVLLDTKNRVQKIHTVYRGTLDSAPVRVGEIFKEAIRCNSAAIVLAHNHPSNNPAPSVEDILVTRQVVEAGKLLDIECIDHLIICAGSFTSLREKGLGGFN